MERILVPHVKNGIHHRTAWSLCQFLPSHERVEVTTPHGYHDLLEAAWSTAQDLVIIEQDIEVHGAVLEGFRSCPEYWCTYPYRGPSGTMLEAALGCTRFRAELLEMEPDALQQAGAIDDCPTVPPKDWRRLDSRLRMVLEGGENCWLPHVHQPPVIHWHPYANIG